MKKFLVKFLCFTLTLCLTVSIADAQRKPAKKRSSQKRTTTSRTTKGNQKAKITPTVDSVAAPLAAPTPRVDSLPLSKVKQSLRADEAVETKDIRDQTPLAYENLRVDDAVYRHKIWREIDTR